ncbi:unnamed protein product, partial [Timema podura]|nr:unnamed protein product [Timema podura]
MSWNVEDIVEDALTSSSRAVQFDKDGKQEVAAFYYREAAKFLDLAVKSAGDGVNKESWQNKAEEYKERAKELDQMVAKERTLAHTEQSTSQKHLQQCHFLFLQALDADESGNKDEAVELYSQAIQLGLTAKKTTGDVELQEKLTNLARKALERAEELKGISAPEGNKPQSGRVSVQPRLPALDENKSTPSVVRSSAQASRPPLHRGSSAHLKVTGQANYTEEEKRVLLQTSRINNIEYLPFMSVDLDERFQYTLPFTDRDGLLALSPKQHKNFSKWTRPSDFCPEPKMVVGQHVDCFSIKQTIVSDCSFVASLAVSALYERRFGRRLVTSIIYPRNSRKEPIYNPFGKFHLGSHVEHNIISCKYMVKLHINGVPRKIIIDDQLPLGRHGELLCSYSSNKNELWISLLEKAYMKVMGGYDFPGSNSVSHHWLR